MKLTSQMLRKLVEQEMARFGDMKDVEDVDAKEIDADEYGTDKALEKPIDVAKALGVAEALKVEEARLIRRIKKIREQKARLRENILKRI